MSGIGAQVPALEIPNLNIRDHRQDRGYVAILQGSTAHLSGPFVPPQPRPPWWPGPLTTFPTNVSITVTVPSGTNLEEASLAGIWTEAKNVFGWVTNALGALGGQQSSGGCQINIQDNHGSITIINK